MEYAWTAASVELKNFIRNKNLIKSSWNGVCAELETWLLECNLIAEKR